MTEETNSSLLLGRFRIESILESKNLLSVAVVENLYRSANYILLLVQCLPRLCSRISLTLYSPDRLQRYTQNVNYRIVGYPTSILQDPSIHMQTATGRKTETTDIPKSFTAMMVLTGDQRTHRPTGRTINSHY
ncbi:hypothetical protein J6590_043200 [Homalodisca vitripennis]|nr:hypothetical protein J6590_043200 [Homalodisca vitripennis]